MNFEQKKHFDHKYEEDLLDYISSNKGSSEEEFLLIEIHRIKEKMGYLENVADEELERKYLEKLRLRVDFNKASELEIKNRINYFVQNERSMIPSNLSYYKEVLRLFELKLHRINPSINISSFQESTHPKIFRNLRSFIAFQNYTQKYIINPYIDFSYVFQRMLHEGHIYYMKHREFMIWLNDNGYISDKRLDEFLRKENFRSLTKSYSEERENNFNNTFHLNES